MTKGDLISREFLKTAIHNFFNGLNHTPTEEDIQRYIEVAPPVENKGDFEGMTNGEVIQALFPNGKVIKCDEAIGYEQMLDDKYSYCSWFDGLWWDAPYKAEKGGEEE